jgi:hypothetical protein
MLPLELFPQHERRQRNGKHDAQLVHRGDTGCLYMANC